MDTSFVTYLERTRNEPVYVILGVQGSGTNLLGRILRKFYGFSLLRDRAYITNAAGRLGAAPTPAAIRREIRAFEGRAFPSALRRKTAHIIADYGNFPGVMEELRPDRIRNGADFAHLIQAYRAFSLGTDRMAVKSDDLWMNMPALGVALPNRRTLLITRDFRDNLLSISGKDFGPIEPLRAAQYVKERIGPYAAEYRRAGPDGLHVTFEMLVTDVTALFGRLSTHFGLAPVVDPETAAQRFKARPNKTQKWKGLPKRELALCEGLLYEELVAFGYQPESPGPVLPGSGDVAAATARDLVKRVPQKINRLARRLTQ
jgi:hypothetical protein